jgi:hypothetical protein
MSTIPRPSKLGASSDKQEVMKKSHKSAGSSAARKKKEIKKDTPSLNSTLETNPSDDDQAKFQVS